MPLQTVQPPPASDSGPAVFMPESLQDPAEGSSSHELEGQPRAFDEMALLSDSDFFTKLLTMRDMGFGDRQLNEIALIAADKDLETAVQYVIENRVHRTGDGTFTFTIPEQTEDFIQPSQPSRTMPGVPISRLLPPAKPLFSKVDAVPLKSALATESKMYGFLEHSLFCLIVSGGLSC